MDRLLGFLVLAAMIGVPVFFLWGKRAFDRAADESLRRIYAAAERQARAFGPSTPEVSFVYHTYSGILLYVHQAEHRFSLPQPVAESTISALFQHTLKFGFLSYGALLIPVLAYFNYLAQRRSIAKQGRSPGVQNAMPRPKAGRLPTRR
jgi:hypothetical protein